MPDESAEKDGKKLTKYQQEKLQEKQKEFGCGVIHTSIEEALIHAEDNLGFRDSSGKLTAQLKPYLGTTRFGSGTVVGWQVGSQTRFRLDHDPEFEQHNREAEEKKTGVHKGTQGIHVNEEDFSRAERQKVCHSTRSSLDRANLYWRRWSSRYGSRGMIQSRDLDKESS